MIVSGIGGTCVAVNSFTGSVPSINSGITINKDSVSMVNGKSNLKFENITNRSPWDFTDLNL